jgi:hypothetical protein
MPLPRVALGPPSGHSKAKTLASCTSARHTQPAARQMCGSKQRDMYLRSFPNTGGQAVSNQTLGQPSSCHRPDPLQHHLVRRNGSEPLSPDFYKNGRIPTGNQSKSLTGV